LVGINLLFMILNLISEHNFVMEQLKINNMTCDKLDLLMKYCKDRNEIIFNLMYGIIGFLMIPLIVPYTINSI